MTLRARDTYRTTHAGAPDGVANVSPYLLLYPTHKFGMLTSLRFVSGM
jgi:hypothetical protein